MGILQCLGRQFGYGWWRSSLKLIFRDQQNKGENDFKLRRYFETRLSFKIRVIYVKDSGRESRKLSSRQDDTDFVFSIYNKIRQHYE